MTKRNGGKITRRDFAKAAALAGLSVTTGCASSGTRHFTESNTPEKGLVKNMKSSPNILWICSDQQRWDTLGCYGNRFVRTPNLDRLAQNGTIFQNAFSQSPVCTPSRASFLTGRYPRTARSGKNGADIPADEVLVTKILADAGYVCGLSGKLHLSACNPSVCPTMERRIDDGYSEFHWSHHSGPGWNTHNEYWAWLAERGAKYETPPHPKSKRVQLGMPEHLHQTTWCVEKAIDFIKDRAGDAKPWLFSVNMFDPHHPFDAPPSYLNRYMDFLDEIPLPNYVEGELENKSPYQKVDHQGAYADKGLLAYDEMSDFEHRLLRASYWAMCDLIDAQVGRLLAALAEAGQAEDTIIIYTSDHGEMLGDHGIYLKGPYFYETAIHVPLIVSWPGHFKAQRSDALVELVDIPQTLLDATGIPHHPGMQGLSLFALASGDKDLHSHRDDVYCEYYNAMPGHKKPVTSLTMVRTEDHKMIADHGNNTGELYDLKHDPNETHNLWDDKECQNIKTEMLMRLCKRMAATVDPLPLRHAGY